MSLKHKIISGVLWQGLEKVGSQGIGFVVQIILARLLAPDEFGIIALMTVFVALCNVVVDSGFSNALIQKKNADQIDFCTVFFINIALGLFLYGIMFLAAPFVARFYRAPYLSCYMRCSSLTLVITSFSRVQQAFLNKHMMFYLSFRINWIAMTISGVVGIVMAYRGFGVWSLIAQQIGNAAMVCLLLWLLVKWRPQLRFDWGRAKGLFGFGWKFMVSSLLNTLYNDIYSVVIGKIANLRELGFYNRGKAVPALGMGVISSSVGSVLFPAFSKLQDDRPKMKELARRGLRNIMFLVIPVLTLLCILAEPLVRIVFTDKWLPCVIYLQLCCVDFLFWPFHTTNLQIINACGRSDVYLILEIVKKVQAVSVILLTYRYGVVAMVAVGAAMGFVNFIENAWFNRKLIGYSPWAQLWDILPLLLIAVAAGGGVYYGVRFVASPWLRMTVGGGAFMMLYLGIALLFGQLPPDVLGLLRRKRIA